VDTHRPAHTGALPLTGERTVPGIAEENYWLQRHVAAYEFAAPLMAGRSVLEVGCGEGYGTARLARSATRIVGVDYDALTVAHAAATYPQAHFVRANLAALPVLNGSVDAVATLQVIEHVWNHGEFVRECLRVLRPGGRLLVTTPNRLTFSPGLDRPSNPFHTHEFTAPELIALLTGNGFEIEQALGLYAGERIAALDRRHDSLVDAQLAHPPSEWTSELRADVVSVAAADFPILDAESRRIDEALDLVIVARRP
jgi:SAM-dependent methyltransferase